MSWDFTDTALQRHIGSAEFGIEKESLRVTPDGLLAKTPHPFSQKYIDRDFCENQLEIISSVHFDVGSLFEELRTINAEVQSKLRETGELMWPFSNPPRVESEDDIPIAHFDGELKEREDYRRYLAEKYGKAKMLFSGIHLNFSFPRGMLREAFAKSGGESLRAYTDGVYIELGKKLLRYTWLIVYLTAASPLADDSFLKLSGLKDKDRYASIRCSEDGYWNDFLPSLDFSCVEGYCKSIERYIESGELYAASELYYPLRFKPRGKNSLDALRENGVNHVELRCLDMNPLSPVGLFEDDVRFIHLLMLYLMSLEDKPLEEAEQKTAVGNIKTAALYNDKENLIDLNGEKLPLRQAAQRVLGEIELFAERYAPVFLNTVHFQKQKLSRKRYSEMVRERFKDYIKDGLRLAREYRGNDYVYAIRAQLPQRFSYK